MSVTDFRIPKVFLEEFVKEPRIVREEASPGYWPVPLSILQESKFFNRLFEDREFASTHRVVIMRMGQ
jgi:hypothetical protein